MLRVLLPFYTCFISSPSVIFCLLIRNYFGVANTLYFWGKSMMWFIGQPYTVEGIENIDKNKRYIVISNHGSMLDIPLHATLFRTPLSWVMKESLLRIPIANIMFLLGIGIPIPRANARKSQEKLFNSVNQLRLKMKPNIIIYPEGTRTRTGQMNNFKRGFVQLARHYEMDILPITICGAYGFCSTEKIFPNPKAKLKVIIHPVQKLEDIKDLTDKEIIQNMYDLISKDYYV